MEHLRQRSHFRNRFEVNHLKSRKAKKSGRVISFSACHYLSPQPAIYTARFCVMPTTPNNLLGIDVSKLKSKRRHKLSRGNIMHLESSKHSKRLTIAPQGHLAAGHGLTLQSMSSQNTTSGFSRSRLLDIAPFTLYHKAANTYRKVRNRKDNSRGSTH